MPSWVQLPANAAEKTQLIIQKDFAEYPYELMSRIKDHDACIWALGKSANGVPEQEYTTLTYTYPIEAAKALIGAGVGSEEKPFQFVFVSGDGADQSGKGMMWARVKVTTNLFSRRVIC